MRKIEKYVEAATPHLVVWGFILLTSFSAIHPLQLVEGDGYRAYFRENLPVWIVYFLFFYLSYLLLIPGLLFRRQWILYSLVTLILLAGSFSIVKYYRQLQYREQLHYSLSEHKEELALAQISELQSPKNSLIRNEFTLKVMEEGRRVRRMERLLERSYDLSNYNPLLQENGNIFYGLLLILALTLVLSYIKRSNLRGRQLAHREKERTETELAYLKQQINPHFLFNALNSIYSLVLPHNDKAADAVVKLSSILRYMLYETDKQKVSLSKELEIVEDYIALQRLKLSDATQVELIFEGDSDGYVIEPLILIPIIENAFKHGADSSVGSSIRIVITVRENWLSMKTENPILPRKTQPASSGLGLRNVRRRLELSYPERHKLEVRTTDDMFRLYLSIQLL